MLLNGGVALAHEFSGAHGTVTVDRTAPNIARVLSSAYGDSFGTKAWVRKEFSEPVEVEGRQLPSDHALMIHNRDKQIFL